MSLRRPTPAPGNARPAEEENCFDVLRLLLALLVVYTHAFLLGGFGTEGFLRLVRGQTLAGTFAVLGFFGISGFLVSRSFDLRRDGIAFVRARLARILPGLYLALVVSAFVLAPTIARLNPRSGPWEAAAAGRFVRDNLLVHVANWNVGQVLAGLPYDGSLDGALWSLFPELCCYGLILALGLTGCLHPWRAGVALAAGGAVVLNALMVLWTRLPQFAPTLFLYRGFTPFVSAFLVGSALYCFRDRLRLGQPSAVAWSAAAILLLALGGWSVAGPVLLPVALISVAYSFRRRLPADLSYGIYVNHFPALQVCAAAGIAHWGFTLFLSSALLLTLPLALFSWFLVEHPALRLKGRRIRPDRG